MHIEIERKFLALNDSFKKLATSSSRIKQGYIACENGRTVRIRIRDDKGILTIKGPSKDGMSKFEWEKEIPLNEAENLFSLCQNGVIDKTRYIVPCNNSLSPKGTKTERFFEIDEFYGDNKGLIMIEIELGSTDEVFEKPSFVGPEVTGDHRFYNAYLSKHPYKEWLSH